MAIGCGVVAAIAVGCGGHSGTQPDGGGQDGGAGGAVGHVDAFDAVLDTPAVDSSPADLANDRPMMIDDASADRSPVDPDASDRSADANPDAADAGVDASSEPPPICAGLGKVEDPRGCSGASICDGAGKCVSRFTLFPITSRNVLTSPFLFQIATGPDGNLWFSDQAAMGRMTPDGSNQEFLLPGKPIDLTPGPDGNFWFSDEDNNVVGRLTPTGMQREFPRLAGRPLLPEGIVTGPDGNLWFTDGDAIERMTTTGVLTTFSIPTTQPYANDIAVGSDGNLWFTEQVGKIGRITPSGTITEFTLPPTTMTTFTTLAFGITSGPDGNLWFTEPNQNQIGRITPSGTIAEFSIPTAASFPTHIVAGPEGNLWFIERSRIGRITPTGVVTEFAPPTANVSLGGGIAAGPDGGVWFSQSFPGSSDPGPYQAWLVRIQP